MHLSKGLKLNTHTLTILSADKDAEQMEFSRIAARMKNNTATLEISLAVSLKVRHIS